MAINGFSSRRPVRCHASPLARLPRLSRHLLHALALGTAVACLGCAASSATPDVPSAQQANGIAQSMSDDLLLTQGTTLHYGDFKLGLDDVVDGSEIRLSVWRPGQEDKLAQLRLHPSDVFAVGDGFLRVSDSSTAGSGRATVALTPFRDTGVGVPNPSHLLLSQDGQLEVGDQAVIVHGIIGSDSAQLEIWPKRFPRELVKPEHLTTQVVALGSRIGLQQGHLQVRRLQPSADELRGFVEFAQVR